MDQYKLAIWLPILLVILSFGLTRRVRPYGFRPTPVRLFATLRMSLVLTQGISPAFDDGVHLFILPTTTGPVPSLSGHHVISYRGRSPPRVHRHRTGSPQGSLRNGCYLISRKPLMDHFLCVSLSHPTTNGTDSENVRYILQYRRRIRR